MQPLISVIVPIYGIEQYVGMCIESIINQTYKHLEIILVDDGSPDRCPEICDLYAQKDSRIKVIHKLNGGLVSARKAGLTASTGKYVGYVDGDDWIDPSFYEALYTSLVTSDSDMVAAGQSRDLFGKQALFVNSIPLGIYDHDELQELFSSMLSYGCFYRPGITTYVWNKLFKREILLPHQMNVDERISIGEDAAVTYPVMSSCKRICVTDNCGYHYRQREDSMLKKSAPFEAEAEKLRILYEYMSNFAKGQPERYNLQRQVDDYILGICIMRSGGVLPKAEEEYQPFGKSLKNKDIVIYSGGTFGQQLVNRSKENEHCNVVGWVDDDYWEYRRCCLDVDAVESITELTFDYVLIASVDSKTAEIVKRRLKDCGASSEKILTVHYPEEMRSELIQRYLY